MLNLKGSNQAPTPGVALPARPISISQCSERKDLFSVGGLKALNEGTKQMLTLPSVSAA